MKLKLSLISRLIPKERSNRPGRLLEEGKHCLNDLLDKKHGWDWDRFVDRVEALLTKEVGWTS